MKSTTVRFADPVYRELEAASRLTGLPINSIVTVACLEWLNRNVPPGMPTVSPVPLAPWKSWQAFQAQRLRRMETRTVELAGDRPPGGDPLWAFTAAAQDALGRAHDAAERSRQPWIGTSHLLQGLTEVPEGRAAQALRRLGVAAIGLPGEEPEEAAEATAATAGAEPSARRLPTRQVRRAMQRAQSEAEREGAAQIGTDHLLLGLLLGNESRVAEALEAAGVTEAELRDALTELTPED